MTGLLYLAVRLAGPIMLMAMGGLMAQKVGVFNLGLEGFALFAAFGSVVGAHISGSVLFGVLFGVAVSVAAIMVFAVLVLELKVQPVICAIAIIMLSSALTRYLVRAIFGVGGRFVLPTALSMPIISADWLGNIPLLGPILNEQSALTLLSLICPFILYYVLYRTGYGLKVRSTGLDEEAALAAGIHTKRIKYSALLLNGVFCGLGGAQLALSVNMFNMDMTGGRGFIALAAVTLATGRPILVGLVVLLFGIADASKLNLLRYDISSFLLDMIPYAMAVIAAILPFFVRNVVGIIKQKITQRKSISEYYKLNLLEEKNEETN